MVASPIAPQRYQSPADRGNGNGWTSTCRTTPVSDEALAASQARLLLDHPIGCLLDHDGDAARHRVKVLLEWTLQPETNASARDGLVLQLAEAAALDLGSSGP